MLRKCPGLLQYAGFLWNWLKALLGLVCTLPLSAQSYSFLLFRQVEYDKNAMYQITSHYLFLESSVFNIYPKKNSKDIS